MKNTAVLGLGTMGHGIAQVMALAECRVRAFDASPAARDSLNQRLNNNLHELAGVGLVDEADISPTIERITVCDSEADALRGAEFVTEAIVEDLTTKQELFARIEALVDPTTILASNTSSYPITDIARDMQHPGRAIVTHWFNPPHICPLVEVIPGERTAAGTVEATIALHERIGKMPVRVNQELPGFM
ncbi:MAG: 3-hydroxyacyl-CoA dehydrogenase NAD-binding domain-containing protein, partial [Pirellulaceae bacterium]|nr:3-hydroxyacyl-CoA dehydrogenase NAD-binding domain-containing protein [Pirellulaceae bacterium]